MPGRTTEDVPMDEAPTSHQPEDEEEEAEAQEGSPEHEDEEEEEQEEPQRVKILPGSTDTAASFEFIDEGHTLGNALRYIIMKNPDVEFCAYAIPHPSEAKMNLRIQTYDGTAVSALQKGLKDLQALSDTVAEEFIRAKEEFGRS
ncbi:RBP11-like subunits of RNA polymerase [Colletotrichum falcatum]|nr:RBP11-like subunits of RNA polymerase [Colletotrichum falcatum]